MSKPGFWMTKEGIDIPITGMEDMHIKHVCRFLCKKLACLTPGSYYHRSCEDKLIEFGNAAQTRNLLPAGDITLEQLKACVTTWQIDWDARQVAVAAIIPDSTPGYRPRISWERSYAGRIYGRSRQNKTDKPVASHPAIPDNQRPAIDIDERQLDTDL